MDDEIKRNLNDCLEEAYSEIKDLNEICQKPKIPVNNKSTNTTEDSIEPIETPASQQQVIDLSLATRFRASLPESTYRRSNPPPVPDKPPRDLILDKVQLEYQSNYRKTIENNKHVPNYLQRLEQNTPIVNMNIDRNCQNHQPMLTNIAKDLQSDQTFNNGVPVTLNLRFKRHRSTDTYDFTKNDNKKERTRNRPVCKWYLRNECNSEVCIYNHPEPEETSNPIPETKQNSNRPVCRYYLQNRCWFGDWHCRNHHPKQY